MSTLESYMDIVDSSRNEIASLRMVNVAQRFLLGRCLLALSDGEESEELRDEIRLTIDDQRH